MVSLSSIKRQIHSLVTNEWKRKYSQFTLPAHLTRLPDPCDPKFNINKLSNPNLAAFIIGEPSYTNTHRNHTNSSSTACCECGQGKQDINHLLRSCVLTAPNVEQVLKMNNTDLDSFWKFDNSIEIARVKNQLIFSTIKQVRRTKDTQIDVSHRSHKKIKLLT